MKKSLRFYFCALAALPVVFGSGVGHAANQSGAVTTPNQVMPILMKTCQDDLLETFDFVDANEALCKKIYAGSNTFLNASVAGFGWDVAIGLHELLRTNANSKLVDAAMNVVFAGLTEPQIEDFSYLVVVHEPKVRSQFKLPVFTAYPLDPATYQKIVQKNYDDVEAQRLGQDASNTIECPEEEVSAKPGDASGASSIMPKDPKRCVPKGGSGSGGGGGAPNSEKGLGDCLPGQGATTTLLNPPGTGGSSQPSTSPIPGPGGGNVEVDGTGMGISHKQPGGIRDICRGGMLAINLTKSGGGLGNPGDKSGSGSTVTYSATKSFESGAYVKVKAEFKSNETPKEVSWKKDQGPKLGKGEITVTVTKFDGDNDHGGTMGQSTKTKTVKTTEVLSYQSYEKPVNEAVKKEAEAAAEANGIKSDKVKKEEPKKTEKEEPKNAKGGSGGLNPDTESGPTPCDGAAADAVACVGRVEDECSGAPPVLLSGEKHVATTTMSSSDQGKKNGCNCGGALGQAKDHNAPMSSSVGMTNPDNGGFDPCADLIVGGLAPQKKFQVIDPSPLDLTATPLSTPFVGVDVEVALFDLMEQ